MAIEQELVSDREVAGRRAVVVRNTFPSSMMDPYYFAYVSLEKGEPAYRVVKEGRKVHLPDVHGGITHRGGLPIKSVEQDRDYWIGWDINHGFSDDPSAEEVLEDVEDYCKVLNTFTIEKAVKKKMAREPSWFTEALKKESGGDE